MKTFNQIQFTALLSLCMFLSLTVRSQIVVKKFDNFVETAPVAKPEPYDSLQNLRREENFIDNYKYIGHKVYLPSFSDACDLFSVHSTVIPATKNKVVLISNKDNERYSDVERASKIKNIKTFVYKPVNTSFGVGINGPAVGVCSDKNTVSDKYYTIINVLNRKDSEAITAKIRNSEADRSFDETTIALVDIFVNYYL